MYIGDITMKDYSLTLKIFLFITILCTSVSIQALPILQVDAGKVTGVKNLNLNGTNYDVIFSNGSCITLFSGCDEPHLDFPFQTLGEAHEAIGTAIGFVYGHSLNYRQPSQIQGCDFEYFCLIFAPYGINTSNGYMEGGYLFYKGPGSTFSSDELAPYVDTAGESYYTFAVFTEVATASVPESSALILLSLGLVGLGLQRSRNRMH